MDSNAGHLNNRPVHDMVLLLLPSGGNWNYTGWLADRLHWLLLTAALCNGWLADRLHWLLLTAALCNSWLADRLHWLLLTAALCNGCCCLQLLPSAMAGCYLQWLLLSATAALCNGCCYLQWLLLSAMAAVICNGCYCLQWLLLSEMAAAVCCFWKLWIHWSGCGSPGFTAGLPVEMCQTSNCSNSCGHGTNKCSIISM